MLGEFLNSGQGASASQPISFGALPVTNDPLLELPGLFWNFFRIRAPQAWKKTIGNPSITVGVMDTGLDFTHSELAGRISAVVDFSGATPLQPTACQAALGGVPSDEQLAASFVPPAPAGLDWNGHGSWIGGTIGAALDGQGKNGLAPAVTLVSLKIAQWCGAAYASSVIEAILYAAAHNIDIVNISFGHYLDRSNHDQDVLYRLYRAAVKHARKRGTTIVAAAGNDHVRVGRYGRVTSHGSLTTPGTTAVDLHGLWQVPGGLHGVIDVAATNNVVNAPSLGCSAGTTGTPSDPFALASCKPMSDPHQPTGVGRINQLTYYSNYGERIDVAAPGGARKFNVPGYDRGGTPGFPWPDDPFSFNVWEAFSITSNWTVASFAPPPFSLFAVPCLATVAGHCYSRPSRAHRWPRRTYPRFWRSWRAGTRRFATGRRISPPSCASARGSFTATGPRRSARPIRPPAI